MKTGIKIAIIVIIIILIVIALVTAYTSSSSGGTTPTPTSTPTPVGNKQPYMADPIVKNGLWIADDARISCDGKVKGAECYDYDINNIKNLCLSLPECTGVWMWPEGGYSIIAGTTGTKSTGVNGVYFAKINP